jgi:ubiquitin carboxyl-terminal hydrolase 44/49
MTGLRNLGQTCFLNSVLQALLNSELLRLCLLSLGEQGLLDPASAPESIDELRATSLNSKSQAPRRLNRQTTVECHDVLEDKSLLPSLSRKRRGANEAAVQPDTSSLSFCHKLESLFRVIWSGKWPVVTPHAILSSVWQLIPSFRGFQQQDAQELLCEMVEQIQTELDELSHRVEPAELPALNVLRRTFGGQVSNTVKCLNCKAASRRVEPFFDLSLDFPPGLRLL